MVADQLLSLLLFLIQRTFTQVVVITQLKKLQMEGLQYMSFDLTVFCKKPTNTKAKNAQVQMQLLFNTSCFSEQKLFSPAVCLAIEKLLCMFI